MSIADALGYEGVVDAQGCRLCIQYLNPADDHIAQDRARNLASRLFRYCSNQELAEACDVPQGTFGRWRRGAKSHHVWRTFRDYMTDILEDLEEDYTKKPLSIQEKEDLEIGAISHLRLNAIPDF